MKRFVVGAALAAAALLAGCAQGHGASPRVSGGNLSHAYVESRLARNAARVVCNDGHDMPLRRGVIYWCHFEGKLSHPDGYRYLAIKITNSHTGKYALYEVARSPKGA